MLRRDRDEVISKLRAHAPELKAAGIVRLRLFGSVARGEAGNDIDLVAEFDRPLSLIDLVGRWKTCYRVFFGAKWAWRRRRCSSRA